MIFKFNFDPKPLRALNFYKSILLIALCCFTLITLPPESYPAGSTLKTNFDFGRRGLSGLIEEEDLKDEFDFSKYRIKFSQEVDKKFSYYVAHQLYIKDFDNFESLDNTSNSCGIGAGFLLYTCDKYSLSLRPDLKFKYKRYQDNSRQDYDQIKFKLPITVKRESDWTIKLTGGINSYEYLNLNRDEFRTSSKIDAKKEFLDNRLLVGAFYKFLHVDRERMEDRIERVCGGTFRVKLDHSLIFIRELELGIAKGLKNTIEEEEREDTYDYKFLRWCAKTKYDISEKMGGYTKYTDLNKDYVDFNHDFDGFIVDNSITYKIWKTKKDSSRLKAGYSHKQIGYPYVSSLNLYKDSIGAEGRYTRRGDWKGSLGFETRFYRYPHKKTKDKIYYIATASIEKYLMKRSLLVGFVYRYTFKNYLHKIDITEDLYKIHATYRF